MKLFLVTISDRHTDPEYHLFRTSKKAVAYAKELRKEFVDAEEWTGDELQELDERSFPILDDAKDFVYLGDYNFEGDSIDVRIVEVE